MLTLAISKGRIWNEAQPLLAALGCAPMTTNTRSLILPTAAADVRLIIVRAQDAPVFIACGAADVGIAGGDVLAEKPLADLYQPLELGIARCRLVAAAKKDTSLTPPDGKLTVATKYPALARAYFNRQGISADYIKLHGTLELAPLVGLADVIVDIADSGDTLRAHGLEEIAAIHQFSAMLITNRAASRRNPQVADLQARLAEIISANHAQH